jgi:hypothetical protein
MNDLELARRRFESRWSLVQAAVRRELGAAPRRLGWIVGVAAAAAGLALALGIRRLRRGEQPPGA